MKRMGINEFQDKLFTGKLDRRQAFGALAAVGVLPTVMTFGAGRARAAQQPLVL